MINLNISRPILLARIGSVHRAEQTRENCSLNPFLRTRVRKTSRRATYLFSSRSTTGLLLLSLYRARMDDEIVHTMDQIFRRTFLPPTLNHFFSYRRFFGPYASMSLCAKVSHHPTATHPPHPSNSLEETNERDNHRIYGT